MQHETLIERGLTRSVIGAFFGVYNILGYGLLGNAYAGALERELVTRGHRVAREVTFVIRYKGHPVGVHRLDMVVDEKLVVEIKSTERIPQSVLRQLLSYLKASKLEVGLLFHFGPSPRFYRQIFRHT